MSKASRRERQRQSRAARPAVEQRYFRRRRLERALRVLVVVGVVVAVAGGVVIAVSGGDEESAARPRPRVEYATITTSLGDIVVEVSDEEAPRSAAQFVRLAREGFYDGLTIHRVATGIDVIQGGDPAGDGTGGSGTTVPDELPDSDYRVGDVAFANAGPGTSDSQFFIVVGEGAAVLPHSFNRFGRVVEGLEVAQAILGLAPPSGDGAPTTEVRIERVVVTRQRPASTTTTSTTGVR